MVQSFKQIFKIVVIEVDRRQFSLVKTEGTSSAQILGNFRQLLKILICRRDFLFGLIKFNTFMVAQNGLNRLRMISTGCLISNWFQTV